MAAEFGRSRPTGRACPQPVLSSACFGEVLASVGWEGKQHKIFEAYRTWSRSRSVRMLRTVLARLDVSLVPIERRAADVRQRRLSLPIVENEDDCRLRELGAGAVEIYGLSGARKQDATLPG